MPNIAILKNLRPEVAFELGRVQMAHASRAYAREKAKKATTRFGTARNDYSTFGMYDDCGPSYAAAYEEAKGTREYAVNLKISAEKHYKKVKHEFLSAFPEEAATLEALLPGATAGDVSSC